jgi:methyl-accepting chemotaxis protein
LADKAGEALNRIIEAIASVTSLSSEIATATQEQARGSQLILKAAERMNNLALQVKNATKEQSVGSEQIRQAVEEMEKLTISVTAAVEQQRKCSSEMLKIVEQAEQFNGENLEPLNQLKELAGNLKEQVGKLLILTNRLD